MNDNLIKILRINLSIVTIIISLLSGMNKEKRLSLICFLVFSITAFAQNCNNIGFEDGSTNWTCKSGSYGLSPGPCVPKVNLDKTGCINGGDNSNVSPIIKSDNRHTIMSDVTLMDPNTGTNTPVPCVAPGNLFPSGVNTKSFRIGNAIAGGYNPSVTTSASMAESVSFTFVVDETNAGLTYMYAVFLNEATTSLHSSQESPRFIVKITTSGGATIDCGLYNVDASVNGGSGDFLIGGNGPNFGQWKYRNWTKVALDLTSYIGSTITIEFITADCLPKGNSSPSSCTYNPGGHSAYAYIDLYCAPLKIISPSVCANQPTVEICAPDGYASYEWDPSGPGIQTALNQKCVTIQNPKAGDTYTVSMQSVAGLCPTNTTITLKGSDFNIATVATCPDKSIKLSPIAVTGQLSDYDWKWEPQQNLDNYNIAEPTFTPGTTTTYTVTMIDRDQTNCNRVKTVTVNVGAGYTVTAEGTTICEGDEAVLNASGAETYTWEPGTLTGSSIKVKPTATTTYTVTGKSSTSPCPGDPTTTATVVVNKKTVVTTTNQTICAGETAKLTGTITGGSTTGHWTGGNGTFAPGRNVINTEYTPTAAEETAGSVVLTLESDAAINSTCPVEKVKMTLTIDPKPSVSAGADQTICFGEVAKLMGTMSNSTTGTWSGGNGTYTPNNTTLTATYKPTMDEMLAGTVTLTLTTSSNGKCPPEESTTTIRINPVAVVDAGPDQKICANGTATLSGLFSGGATSGIWSGGSGIYSPNNSVGNASYAPSKAEQKAGKVVLTFTTNDPIGPCPAVYDTMTILIDQLPEAIAGDAQPICDGQQIKLNGSIKNATGGTWSGGEGTFIKDNTYLTGNYIPSATEILAGKVTLILTSDTNGLCPAAVDSATFIINPNPVVNFGVDIPKACPDHCVNFKDSSTVGGNTQITKWNWNFTIDSSKIQNPINICFVNPGFYDVSLTVISDAGCKSSLTKKEYIETYPKPIASFTANPTQTSIYDPTFNFYDHSSSDVESWKWNLGDGKIISPALQNPVHKYQVGVSGTYRVDLFVVNNYGCVDSTFRYVEVLPEFTFFIPNAFTPFRNDGVNDTFFGKGVGIASYHIWIFDRWGNLIFNTTDIDEGWDGRANNGADISQQDVFVWKVKLTDIFGRKHDYIGTVTLVR